MSNGTAAQIAGTYAQSLLDLAEQSGIVDAVETDLETVATLLVEERKFQAFLASPYFAEQTKRDLIRTVFSDNLNRITLNFLSVVIDHNRGGLLPEIIDRYKQLYRAYCGYRTVTAVVARPLPEDQKARLSQDLAAAMNTKVDLEVHVDPSILGGVIFRYDDKMLDNSLRGRLARTVERITHPERRQ
jgi:F-type H+-transporting ATPase subunit delta